MNIKIEKEALSYLVKTIDDDYYSSLADQLFNEYCEFDEKAKRDLAKKYFKNNKLDFASLIKYSLLEKDEYGFFDSYLSKYFEEVNCLNIDKFINNPYYQFLANLDLKEQLENDGYIPYEIFQDNDKKVNSAENYQDFTSFGYFEEEFTFQRIIRNNATWMSLIPHEINSMEEPIKQAKGNVLTYGLGLGYFAYMCAIKDEVTTVTIIESDQYVIDFFKSSILPFIKEKDKFNIIKEDAFKFDPSNKNFDYIFVDIYHGEYDGLISMINFSKVNFGSIKPTYWIEKSILVYLRRHVIASLNEIFIETSFQDNGNDFSAMLIKQIKRYIRNNYLLITKKDLIKILSDEYLLKLTSKLIIK